MRRLNPALPGPRTGHLHPVGPTKSPPEARNPSVPDTTNRRLHPDRELVARMASKDGNALQELMARHERTAYAVAIGILHNSAQAEQAVAQAFLQAFSLADRFVPGEITVLAWLTSLTRRQAEAMAAVA